HGSGVVGAGHRGGADRARRRDEREAKDPARHEPHGAATRSRPPPWTFVSAPVTRSRTATIPSSTFATVLWQRSSTVHVVPRTVAQAQRPRVRNRARPVPHRPRT